MKALDYRINVSSDTYAVSGKVREVSQDRRSARASHVIRMIHSVQTLSQEKHSYNECLLKLVKLGLILKHYMFSEIFTGRQWRNEELFVTFFKNKMSVNRSSSSVILVSEL